MGQILLSFLDIKKGLNSLPFEGHVLCCPFHCIQSWLAPVRRTHDLQPESSGNITIERNTLELIETFVSAKPEASFEFFEKAEAVGQRIQAKVLQGAWEPQYSFGLESCTR